MSDRPSLRSGDGERQGATEGGATEVGIANQLIADLIGRQLVQFRMGYGVHLEVGSDHEVTIETPFEVIGADTRWAGEPLTAGAAGALLPLNLRELTSVQVATDGTLVLAFGAATLTVPPAPMYESWQVRGPDGLLIVCSPGGDYVAVWKPESPT
ncbi:MAG TPA: DUF6188 family protein [Actinomycetes bacterium]|nr:DUF6188 family protein [Actinomycetes bacterium]